MKQDEARKQSTTTLQALGQGKPGCRMKQPDTQREGPAQYLDQDAAREQPKGGGRQQPAGKGSHAQHNKNSKNGNPATPEEAHRGRREDNRKTTGRNTNRKEQHKGVTAREEPRNRPKTKQRARKARPKQKRGVQEGQTTKGRAKDPHKATASGRRSRRVVV